MVGGIIVNKVNMPVPSNSKGQTPCSETKSPRKSGAAGGASMPTPPNKRHLDQEEFDKRLRAKRAVFGSKRSLSLASFKLSAPRKVRLPLERFSSNKPAATEKDKKPDPDHKYLVANAAKGELDSLTLESLININDVGKKMQPMRKNEPPRHL